MPLALILPFILNNMPAIIKMGAAGINFIRGVRTTAQQSSEWTDAHEAEFQSSIVQDALSEEWQPDKPA